MNLILTLSDEKVSVACLCKTLGWLPDSFYAVAMVIQRGFTREEMM